MTIRKCLDTRFSKVLLLVGFGLISLIGLADYLTGYEISITLFYLIPIFLLTWFINKWTGVLAALVSSIAWFVSDHISGHHYSHEFIGAWSAIVYFGFFITFVIVLTNFREAKKKLEQEIAGHKSSEAELKKSEEKYHTLVESTDDSIYVLDRDCKYLFINKKHLSRLGITDNQYIGRSYSHYHSTGQTLELTEIVEKVFTTGDSIDYEHKSERDDECFLLTLSPVKESDGKISAVTVISKNITALKRMEKELRELSLIDELTGLYNRRGFLAMFEQFIKIARRQKNIVFMLYADLDNLKVINDTYGHNEGDMALREVATIFKETFRDSDILARIGGDEFTVVPVGSALDGAERTIARLQENLFIRNSKGNQKYNLSISCGIGCYDPASPCSIDEILVRADASMYEEKRKKQK